jgi:hypothetical protein
MASEAQCDSCGEANPAGSPFCLFCGTYLGWDQPGAGPTGAGQAPPAGPAPSTTPPAPGPAAVAASSPAASPPVPEHRDAPTAPGQPVTDPARATRPAPAPEAASGAAVGTAAGPTCPSCGHRNDPSRRFCERCGFTLVSAARGTAPTRTPTTEGGHWWSRSAEDRAARRAYRRSLPPLYRWRRVIVALLVVVLAVAVVSVVEGNPVEWATQRYHDLRGTTVEVSGVRAVAEPGEEPVPAATDDDASSTWKTPWPPGTPEQTCSAPRPFALRLQWEDPVRVRGVRVSPGTRGDGTVDRRLSPRPATMLVSWEDDSGEVRCESLGVTDEAATRDLELDTRTAVDTLWLRVGSVHEAQGANVPRPVSVRYVAVLSRP